MKGVVPARTLGLRALVATLYFIVSGGPYGLEELVQKVGYVTTMVVLVFTPLVWSVPVALMVGELASALPEEGGYYAWVRRALGPFWGFQEAWLSLAASVFDMGIYPALFVGYLVTYYPCLSPFTLPLGAGFIAAAVAWNLRGTKAVGDGSIVLTVLLLAPFVAICVLACFHVAPPEARFAAPNASHDVLGGILIALWNFTGWDNGSTMAGEVKDPARTYPRGVIAAVLLVSCTYLVPVVAAGVAGVDPSDWKSGSWAIVGGALGGRALHAAVVVGGCISAFGMFNALVLSYSRLPLRLAHDGLLPAVFARTSRTGAPYVAIFALAGVWMLSLGMSFERLVLFDILLYGASLMIEFVALVVLRLREPDLPRPYRVPGGTVGAALLGLPPAVCLVLALVRNRGEEVWGMSALLFGALVALVGVPLYYLAALFARAR